MPGSVLSLPAPPALPWSSPADQPVPGNFRAGNFPAVVKSRAPLGLETASGIGFLGGLRGAVGTQGQPGRPGSPGSARERRQRRREAWACVTRRLPAARTSCWGHRCCRAEPDVHFTAPGPQSRYVCGWGSQFTVSPVLSGSPVTWAVKPAQSDALSQSEAVAAQSLRSKPQKLSKEWVGCRGTAHKCDSYDVPTKEAEQRQRRWDAKPHFRKQS